MSKYKAKPKKEVNYFKQIVFKEGIDYTEREAVIRRAIYCEQNLYPNKPFRVIIAEKDMKSARLKFFVKKRMHL